MQASGWLAYAVVIEVAIKLPNADPLRTDLLHLLVDVVTGIAVSFGLRAIYLRSWSFHLLWRFSLGIGGIVIGSSFWTYMKWISLLALQGQPGFYISWYDFGTWQLASVGILLAWTGSYFGIKYYLLLQRENRRTYEAMAQAKEAQIRMLHYQLSPHFMFNALNSISTLVHLEQNKSAATMLDQLAKFLRYSLDIDPLALIPLQMEVEAMQNYLSIEQTRFGDRLAVEFQIEPEVAQALVPSMLLQPLVENVIKYVISPSIDGGKIAIAAKAESDSLVITVVDDGPGIAEGANGEVNISGGIGLQNIASRLDTLFGNRGSIDLSNLPQGGAQVRLCIPLQYGHSKVVA
ncbi:histidine kinase [Neiella sp. HB171785]|uniref:Histidine kinase n=1 Tax=Neiella litorisoli TaxID=2771431 RepID=A0A8J6UI45_9GAMM|nr:histidine kinase [Neiella litorisoli]MBD1388068.1 histidine kinase [Neiella litorisoli]